MKSAILPSLLRAALDGLERVYIDEGAGRRPMPSLDGWANLLRAIDRAGVDRRELPRLLRLSKRAVRTRLSAGVRAGWVEELTTGRGETTVRLTDIGSEVAARWGPLQDAAEERWEAGFDRTHRLRTSLEVIAAMLPLEHPHYPASYGPADASITGGGGQDWNGVPRCPGHTVSSLPFTALLSQALSAFAMRYEEKSPVALSLSTSVIERIPPEGWPVREVGQSIGLSALNRHGFLRINDAKVYLTPKGLAVKREYDGWIREVEVEWRQHFGDETVSELRRALEDFAIADGDL